MRNKVRLLFSGGCIALLGVNTFGNHTLLKYFENNLYSSFSNPQLKENEQNQSENSSVDEEIIEVLNANTKHMKDLEKVVANLSLSIYDLQRKSAQQIAEQEVNMLKEVPQPNVTMEVSENDIEKISTSQNKTNETALLKVDERTKKVRQQLLSDCCTSPMLHDEDKEQIVTASKIKNIEIVVAYCQSDLTWMYDKVLDQIEKFSNRLEIRMTILSKCGKEDDLVKADFSADPRVGNYTVIQMSNVGGCDYAYAYFIDEYITKYSAQGEENAESTLFLFIKDTPMTKKNCHVPGANEYRTITKLMQLAISSKDFVCGIKPICLPNYSRTEYHDPKLLGNFYLRNYQRHTSSKKQANNKTDFNQMEYKNLADFHLRGLNYSFPNDEVVKVCYGGTFAVPAQRIINFSKDPRTKHVFKMLRSSLSRHTVNNIALEEHFVERTWAGILALPASNVETKLVKTIWPDGKGRRHMPGMFANNVGHSICNMPVSVS